MQTEQSDVIQIYLSRGGK